MAEQLRTDYVQLGGGLDLVSPPFNIKPGRVIAAENFEQSMTGGYRWTRGYERFDGRPAPSAVNFEFVQLDTADGIQANDVLTGPNALSITVVLVDGSDVYGVVTAGSRPIAASTTLSEAGGGSYTVQVDTEQNLARTSTLQAQASKLAGDLLRSAIQAVPGEGPVLGVWSHRADTYAGRKVVGQTPGAIYRATASGWAQVTVRNLINFDGATANLLTVGATLTPESGTQTVTVRKVVYTDTGQTTGFLFVSEAPGSEFVNDANLQVDVSGTPTTAAVQNGAPVIPTVGGSDVWRFVSENYAADTDSFYTYVATGTGGDVFEIVNGEAFPIIIDGVQGKPTTIERYERTLVLGYETGAYRLSVPGEPFNYDTTLGGFVSYIGDRVVDIKAQPGGLIVASSRDLHILTGNVVENFQQREVATDVDILPRSLQVIGNMLGIGARGVVEMRRVEAFGSYQDATISQAIEPIVNNINRTGLTYRTTNINRQSNIYRVFLSDGVVLNLTYSYRKVVGFMTSRLNVAVNCCCSVQDSQGIERELLGGDDGFVYDFGKGTSFDGEVIEGYIVPAFNIMRSPDAIKAFKRLDIVTEAASEITLQVAPAFSYEAVRITPHRVGTVQLEGAGALWDTDGLWNEFYWDGPLMSLVSHGIRGSGVSFSPTIRVVSDTTQPFTIQNYTVRYCLRRQQRGY